MEFFVGATVVDSAYFGKIGRITHIDDYDSCHVIHSVCERKPHPLWVGRNRTNEKFLIFFQNQQGIDTIIPNRHYSEDDSQGEAHNGRVPASCAPAHDARLQSGL